MRSSYVVAFMIAVLALVAGSDSAMAVTYPMGEPANPVGDGFSSGGASNSLRGWRFTCNTSVTVVELGCLYPDGTSQSKTITLWDMATQTILAQETSTPGAGWRWTTVTTPVTLNAGSDYIVVGHTVTASYYFKSPPVPPQYTPTGIIQYRDMRYANGGTPNTYPTSVLTGYQYGLVDIGYTMGPDIIDPAPGSDLPDATEGQTSYSVDFEASGGAAPYTWGGGASVLPAFLEFNPAMGNPTPLVNNGPIGAAGTYTVEVEVADSNGDTKLEAYDLLVNPPPVLTGPPSLPPITEGFGYPTPPVFSATGGTAPLTWTLTGAPAGMTIVGAGVLNGPVDPGTAVGSPYSVTVTIEDANGVQDSLGPFMLTVNPEPAIDVVVAPDAPLGLPYNLAMTSTGGSAPLTWSLTGSPGPFVIDANTGVITGTPATLGTFAFDVVLTDSCNASDTLSLSVDVIDPPTATAPAIPELTEGAAAPAGIAFTATGGDPAQYMWSHSGTLPSGLSLDNVLQGGDMVYELTGAPDMGSAGLYAIDVTVTDTSTTLTDVVSVTITVNPPPAIDITGGLALPGATETGAWTVTFMEEADSGTAPLTWSMGTVTGPAASLPGFTLTDATLAAASVGNPTGDYTVDITVTDANGMSDTQTFTLTIRPVPQLPEGFLSAQEGTLYNETISVLVDTGTAPYTLTVIQDLAPELGLTLTIDGSNVTIAGTPAQGFAGQYNVQINITDANSVSTLATVLFVIVKKPDSGCCGMTSQSGSAGTLWLLALLATMGVGVLRRRL